MFNIHPEELQSALTLLDKEEEQKLMRLVAIVPKCFS